MIIVCRKVLTLIICVFSLNLGAQGMEFFHGTFKEALVKASQDKKLIFVDAYTVWCGPCRRMAANTFPDEKVGTFYNSNFINVKLDMEKGEGKDFSSEYRVQSYPTLLYIDGEGKVVHRASGGRPPDGFIELGQEALRKFDNTADYEKKYLGGDRSSETVLNYIKSLNRTGKSSLKVSNEYLATQTNLKTPAILEIIFEAATESDSRIFDYLIEYKSDIVKLKGEDGFNKKVEACCYKTFSKAMEYRNPDLLKEAQAKMKHAPQRETAFKHTTDAKYFAATGDNKAYLKSVKTLVSKVIKKDASKLHDLATEMYSQFSQDKKITAYAEKLAKQAAMTGGLSKYYYTYANMLKFRGAKSEALKIAKQGLELAKEKQENPSIFMGLIQELEPKK